MLQPRDLRERVTFAKRSATPDAYGNPVSGPFVDQFTVYARITATRGGEDVLAERLGGRQPFVIVVRQSENTRLIGTEWRAVDANKPPRIFNIRSVTNDERNRQIELLCELGVAI